MYVTPEQIQASGKANVEALLAVTNMQLAALEKFASLNANATRSALEEAAASARALFGAKDAQEFVGLQNSFAQPAIDRVIAYSKDVCEVAIDASAKLSKLAERRFAELNQDFATALDQVAKNAPAGSAAAQKAKKAA